MTNENFIAAYVSNECETFAITQKSIVKIQSEHEDYEVWWKKSPHFIGDLHFAGSLSELKTLLNR